jgi:hypothetical protein
VAFCQINQQISIKINSKITKTNFSPLEWERKQKMGGEAVYVRFAGKCLI